jgi:Glycosyl transferase family 11
VIVVRFKGGFGNQLFQYAAGRALAARHGVPLYFDTRWYSRSSREREVRRSFDLLRFSVQGQPADRSVLWPFFFDGDYRRHKRFFGTIMSRFFWHRVWIHNSIAYTRAFERLGRTVLIDGYFQDPKFFFPVEAQLREEFRLRIPPSKEILAFAAALSGQHSVCIQVRRTDLVEDPHSARVHGSCSLDYYRAAWARISEKIPSARGFVFADDTVWAVEAFQHWPGVIVADPEWNGPAFMHRFFLMRACRHFIIANSTWGWWAAWLGESPEKTVVMPERWFRDEAMNLSAAGLRLPRWHVC